MPLEDADIKRGIVQLRSADDSESIIGTGFLISSDGHILTCHHNIQAGPVRCTFYHPESGFEGQSAETSVIIQFGPAMGDIAILKCTPPATAIPLPLVSPQLSKNNEVYTYGFPFDSENEPQGLPGSGKVNDIAFPDGQGGNRIVLEAANTITEGFSGAPIVDKKVGGVIGMLTTIPETDQNQRMQSAAVGLSIESIKKRCSVAVELTVAIPTREWPAHFKPLPRNAPDRKQAKEIKFSDYLYSNRLPYNSRDEFRLTLTEVELSQEFPTESEILEYLLGSEDAPSYYEGVIISGKGGVGKTRMMREIGYRAQEMGWEVLLVDRKAEALEPLKPYLKNNQNYLLIFDYLEEHQAFEPGITDVLTEGLARCQVKLLANCRNTFKNRTSSQYPRSDFIHHASIDSDHPLEIQYKNYVVRKIIDGIQHPTAFLPEKLSSIAEVIPAFAVFVRYLIESDRSHDFELDSLANFQVWLIRRLQLTLGYKSEDELPDAVLFIFSILPAWEEAKEKLRLDFPDWYKKLIYDGWIEMNEEGSEVLSTIHDVVTDTLLTLFLSNRKMFLSDTLKDSLHFALNYGQATSWIRSLERIQVHPLFEKVSFSKIFSSVLPNHPPTHEIDCYSLARTPLLNERERLELMQEKPIFFNQFITSRYFILPLAYLTNQAAKDEENEELLKEKRDFIRDLHHQLHANNDNWLQWPFYAARLISTYIRLFGLNEYIEEKAVAFLDRYGGILQSSYIFHRWLEAGGPPHTIWKYLNGFLKSHILRQEVIYVITAWYQADADPTLIERSLHQHLKGKLDRPAASFALRSWLEAAKSLSSQESLVIEYLKKNSGKNEPKFVISAWLNASGSPSTIQQYVVDYLVDYGDKYSASYVLKAWLENKGERKIIRPYVEKYLTKSEEGAKIQFVIAAWLNGGGDLNFIAPYVKDHLRKYAGLAHSQYVLTAWLNAGGQKNVIQSFFQIYLELNIDHPDTSHALAAWLNNEGKWDIIQPFLESHLEACNDHPTTGYVVSALISSKQPRVRIENHATNYFTQHAAQAEAAYPITTWISEIGDLPYIQPVVKKHLAHQISQVEEAAFVISKWLEAGGEHSFIQPFLTEYLTLFCPLKEGVPFVIEAWLLSKGDKAVIQEFVVSFMDQYADQEEAAFILEAWLDARGEHTLAYPYVQTFLDSFSETEKAPFVLRAWLENKGTPEIVRPYVEKYLNKHTLHFDSQFVLSAWMRAEADFELVQDSALQYIQHYRGNFKTSFVIGPWIKMGGDWESVKPALLDLLKRFPNHKSAVYWILIWINHEPIDSLTVSWIDNWTRIHPYHNQAESLWRQTINMEDEGKIRKPLLFWFGKHHYRPSTFAVLSAWANKHGWEDLKDPLLHWLNLGEGTRSQKQALQKFLEEHNFPF